jgi:hypothetical protein
MACEASTDISCHVAPQNTDPKNKEDQPGIEVLEKIQL